MQYDKQLIITFSYFRIALALTTLSLNYLSVDFPLFSNTLLISISYLILCTAYSIYLSSNKTTPLKAYPLAHLLIDQCYILFLIYSNSLPLYNFDILLLISVCIAAILFQGRLATFFAATATVGLFLAHFYSAIFQAHSFKSSINFGFFGFIFFSTSLSVQYLSRKLIEAQRSKEEFKQEAHILGDINAEIVQRMRTGIIVLNENSQIILANDAAEKVLNIDHPNTLHQIIQASKSWQLQAKQANISIANNEGHKYRCNFSSLKNHQHQIIFIDDTTEITQQALQLKLASLGQLTASIAHEIRNPLSSISYSNQLLSDSSTLTASDKELIDISSTNIARINNIITDILSISKETRTSPIKINILNFCKKLQKDYQIQNNNLDFQLEHASNSSQESFFAPFDQNQLRQVLVNIIDNALLHSIKNNKYVKISLTLSINTLDNSCELVISDNGPGVKKEHKDHLFEPFFTTEKNGTGLGLYLSKELCSLNQAHLSYIDTPSQSGATFKIRFSHPNRDILVKINNVDNTHD